MVTDTPATPSIATRTFTYGITEPHDIESGRFGAVVKEGGHEVQSIHGPVKGMCSPGDLIGLGELLLQRGIASIGDLIDFPERGVNWEIPA